MSMMANLRATWDALQPRLKKISADPRTQKASTTLRWILTIALFGFVFWRLSTIGWREVLASVPLSPITILLFLICYHIQPIGDFGIYRRIWKLPLKTLPVFFRKRALNEGVMDYSGEVFVLDWGKRSNIGSLGTVASNVKDVNILSIISSHLLTLGVVVYLLVTNALDKLLAINPDMKMHILLAMVFVVGLLCVTIGFQRKILALPGPDLSFVFIVHVVRVVAFFGCSILLWSAAVPSVPFADWFLFMAAQLLASRLPLVPNRDLVMAGIGVALAPSLGVSATAVAGLFVGVSSAYLITNLLVVLLTQRLPALQRPAEHTNQTIL
jgi:hypothetical protein